MYSREDVELALEGLAEGMSVREVSEMVGCRGSPCATGRPGGCRAPAPARPRGVGWHRCPARAGRVP